MAHCDWKGKNIPNELSIIAPRASIQPMKIQIMNDKPDSLAMRLIIGKRANIGRHVDSPERNTRLSPKRRTRREKNDTWNNPVMAPYVAKIRPMVFGGKPRPPISIGMAKKSGRRAANEMFRNESEP